jgi:predicted nucleic acid-binding protein
VIVLDTNVVSELMRKEVAAEVVAWVDRHPGDQVFISMADAQLAAICRPVAKRSGTYR